MLLAITTFWTNGAFGQGITIGQWRYHMPGKEMVALVETPAYFISATPYSLLFYNKENKSITTYNKIQGLSDLGISALAYDSERDMLLIAYENGNFDYLQHGIITNVPDIRMASFPGGKKIHQIRIYGRFAYLACDFGVVQFDLETKLIRDTWFIGDQGSQLTVFDLTHDGSRFYAATALGLRHAPDDGTNLANFQNWNKISITGLPQELTNMIVYYDGKVFVNIRNGQQDILYYQVSQGWQVFIPFGTEYFHRKIALITSDQYLIVSNQGFLDFFDSSLQIKERIQDFRPGEVWANSALISQDQTLWIADRYYGLIRQQEPEVFEKTQITGPPTASAFGLGSLNGLVWVAPGNISRGGENSWNQDGVFLFEQEQWGFYNRHSVSGLDDVWDIIRIIPNPGVPGKAWAASWTSGLLEISKTGVDSRYDHTNSSLRKRFEIEDHVRVGGAAIDRQGNLWVTNSQVQRPLSVRKPNGEWLSFSGSAYMQPSQIVGNLVIDHQGQKWIVLHQNGGIFVFRENSLGDANDFLARRLSTQEGMGGLPSNEVYSLAVDHNGYVWVGTDKGIAVFYAPSRVFSGEAFNAQRIVVDAEDGFSGYLLGDEIVNSITIDGSNKKWVGTSRSGAFLFSEDARQTLQHFHRGNSPLPSNNVLDIAINEHTGEIFFATDAGIASYRGFATAGSTVHNDVYAYPNPVRPHYHGWIAIKGLVANARIKITDINGQLVYETIAEGGQAVWNGKNMVGQRPATGVYLVFSTNDDGSETMVTKILFVN